MPSIARPPLSLAHSSHKFVEVCQKHCAEHGGTILGENVHAYALAWEVPMTECGVELDKRYRVTVIQDSITFEREPDCCHDQTKCRLFQCACPSVMAEAELPKGEPTLYQVTHTYGNGVTSYQFRSYKTYGGWYGPDGDEPPAEVLKEFDIDFDPKCEETLDISPVDNEEIPTL